ncbi:unnamed protein product [Phaeothamnion confervicola]
MRNPSQQHLRVLVLNVTFVALNIVKAPRALQLLSAQKADVVETEGEIIRSPSAEVEVPSVIALRRYVKVKKPGAPTLRKTATRTERCINLFDSEESVPPDCFVFPGHNRLLHSLLKIFNRDNSTCQYCGSAAQSVDHIIPRSQGGGHHWHNMVACCLKCNQVCWIPYYARHRLGSIYVLLRRGSPYAALLFLSHLRYVGLPFSCTSACCPRIHPTPNQAKGARSPEQAGMRLRSKPVAPPGAALGLRLPRGGQLPYSRWGAYLSGGGAGG